VNALVVDTSAWIVFFRGATLPPLEQALRDGCVVLSPLVASELLSGVQGRSAVQKLKDFLSGLPWHETPVSHWQAVGDLRRGLLRDGFTVSTPDAHVAQCALECGGCLLSYDKIFSKISRHVAALVLMV